MIGASCVFLSICIFHNFFCWFFFVVLSVGGKPTSRPHGGFRCWVTLLGGVLFVRESYDFGGLFSGSPIFANPSICISLCLPLCLAHSTRRNCIALCNVVAAVHDVAVHAYYYNTCTSFKNCILHCTILVHHSRIAYYTVQYIDSKQKVKERKPLV